MQWSDVLEQHGTMRGVRIRGGRVESLLCGADGPLDNVGGEQIEYRIPARKSYEGEHRALRRAIEEGHLFTVFNRLAKNNWKNVGQFRASGMHASDDAVIYILNSVSAPGFV